MKLKPTPVITDNIVLVDVLERGGVLHTPYDDTDTCEITQVGQTFIWYECSYQMYEELLALIEKGSLHFKHVFLQEPECKGVWAIIHKSNKKALSFAIHPDDAVRIKGDDFDWDDDEGDDDQGDDYDWDDDN